MVEGGEHRRVAMLLQTPDHEAVLQKGDAEEKRAEPQHQLPPIDLK